MKEAIKYFKTKKYLITFVIFFIVFIFIYTTIDYLNNGYNKLIEDYGVYLVIINIIINIIMSLISATMLTLSNIMILLKGKDSKATNLTFISVLVGFLTYGCTPCIISFFAAIGISFSVVALPLAGLPYKFISLFLLILGLYLVIRSLNMKSCKIRR